MSASEKATKRTPAKKVRELDTLMEQLLAALRSEKVLGEGHYPTTPERLKALVDSDNDSDIAAALDKAGFKKHATLFAKKTATAAAKMQAWVCLAGDEETLVRTESFFVDLLEQRNTDLFTATELATAVPGKLQKNTKMGLARLKDAGQLREIGCLTRRGHEQYFLLSRIRGGIPDKTLREEPVLTVVPPPPAEAPAAPRGLSAPKTPGAPERSATPKTPGAPERSATPMAPVVPDASAAPRASAVPKTSAVPEAPAVPETSAVTETSAPAVAAAPQSAQTAAPPEAVHDFVEEFEAAFELLDDGNNWVSLLELRRALPEYDRETFDAGLLKVRQRGVFGLEAAEGRHRTPSAEELTAGIAELGRSLLFARRRS